MLLLFFCSGNWECYNNEKHCLISHSFRTIKKSSSIVFVFQQSLSVGLTCISLTGKSTHCRGGGVGNGGVYSGFYDFSCNRRCSQSQKKKQKTPSDVPPAATAFSFSSCFVTLFHTHTHTHTRTKYVAIPDARSSTTINQVHHTIGSCWSEYCNSQLTLLQPLVVTVFGLLLRCYRCLTVSGLRRNLNTKRWWPLFVVNYAASYINFRFVFPSFSSKKILCVIFISCSW